MDMWRWRGGLFCPLYGLLRGGNILLLATTELNEKISLRLYRNFYSNFFFTGRRGNLRRISNVKFFKQLNKYLRDTYKMLSYWLRTWSCISIGIEIKTRERNWTSIAGTYRNYFENNQNLTDLQKELRQIITKQIPKALLQLQHPTYRLLLR